MRSTGLDYFLRENVCEHAGGDYAEHEDVRQPGARKCCSSAHGRVVATPLPEALCRHYGAECHEKQAQRPAPPSHLKPGQQLRRCDPGRNQGQRGPVPGQEGPFVGIGEANIGLGLGRPRSLTGLMLGSPGVRLEGRICLSGSASFRGRVARKMRAWRGPKRAGCAPYAGALGESASSGLDLP
jgi:hypothetical protein